MAEDKEKELPTESDINEEETARESESVLADTSAHLDSEKSESKPEETPKEEPKEAEETEGEVDKLKKQLTEKSGEVDTLKEQLRVAKISANALAERMEGMPSPEVLAVAKNQLNEAKETNKFYQVQVGELTKELHKITKEYEDYRTGSTSNLRQIETNFETIQGENKELEAKIETLVADRESLLKELTRLQAQSGEVKSSSVEPSQELQNLRKQNETLKKANSSLAELLGKAGSKLDSDEITELKEEYQKVVEGYKEEIDRKSNEEIEQIKKQLVEVKQTNAQLTIQLEVYKREIAQLTNEKAQLAETIKYVHLNKIKTIEETTEIKFSSPREKEVYEMIKSLEG